MSELAFALFIILARAVSLLLAAAKFTEDSEAGGFVCVKALFFDRTANPIATKSTIATAMAQVIFLFTSFFTFLSLLEGLFPVFGEVAIKSPLVKF